MRAMTVSAGTKLKRYSVIDYIFYYRLEYSLLNGRKVDHPEDEHALEQQPGGARQAQQIVRIALAVEERIVVEQEHLIYARRIRVCIPAAFAFVQKHDSLTAILQIWRDISNKESI